MEIKYQFFNKVNLLIQKFTGDFEGQLYMQYSGFIAKECRHMGVERVIIDFRDIVFPEFEEKLAPSIEQITAQRRKLNANEIKQPNIKHIFWVTTPFPTVIAQLFIQNFPDLEYHYCYTSEKVYANLNISKEQIDLVEASENLKYTFNR